MKRKLEKALGRSIDGFDLHENLMKCKDILEGFGGHSKAVGVSVSKLNLENLKNRLIEQAKKENIANLIPTLIIDKILNLDKIDRNMVEGLSVLEPFGEGNKMPIFAFKGLKIDSVRSLSEGKHLKLVLKSNNNNYLNAIGFNLGDLACDLKIGDKVDLAGNLEINSFNGVDSIQLNLKDVMKSI